MTGPRCRDEDLGDDGLGDACYRAFFDAAQDAMCIVEVPTGRFVSVNDGMVELYGYSREEFAHLRVHDVSAEPSASAAAVGTLTAGDRLVVSERRHRKRDGTVFPVEVAAVAFEADGRTLGAAVIRDVTHRVETESLLRRNEDRLDALLRHSRDVVAVLDPSGDLTYISPSAPQLFGYPHGSHLGQRVFDLIHPDDRNRAVEAMAARLGSTAPREPLELRVAHVDGSYRTVEVVATNLLDDDDVHGVVVNMRDVTDRVAAEVALRDSERLYRTIIETADEGIWMVDEHGRTTFVNARMAAMLGCTVGEMRARDPFDFVSDDDLEAASEMLARRRAGIGEQHDIRLVRPDGTALWASFSSRPMWSDSGDYTGAVALVTDVTGRRATEAELRRAEVERARIAADADRQRLEVQLARAQRLESLGRLTAGIAHDFNNLVGVILNYAARSARRAGDDQALAREIAGIAEAATRASVITGRLLAFGKSDAGLAEIVDVNAAVRAVRALVAPTLESRGALELDLWAGDCQVSIDPTHLTQVLLNLVLNAADPDVAARRIEVATAVERCVDARGAAVVVRVSDDGGGMTPEVARRAFEPFFTTKPADRGSGLGLATAHTLVIQAGGTVELTTQRGGGTAVTIRLPAAAVDAEVGADVREAVP